MQRNERLNRLAALRTMQHDVAAAQLRSANHALYAASAAFEKEASAIPEARSAMREALVASDQESWLLSCADVAWGRMSMDLCRQQQAAAALQVSKAAQVESEARRASMQMNTAVETLKRDRQEVALRAEQKRLDEIALRMMRQTPEHALGMGRAT